MCVVLALCFLAVFVTTNNNAKVEAAKVRYYQWEVKYEYRSPDCFQKLVLTVNGRSPGPTISAQQGDTVAVELKNSLVTENVAIHWHGIRQVHTSIYIDASILMTLWVVWVNYYRSNDLHKQLINLVNFTNRSGKL